MKSTTKSSSNGTQTSTPNNLAALQQGWNMAGNQASATSGNANDTVNAGLNLVGHGADATTNAAIAALNRATTLSNGGTANAANQYLEPFANGSLTNTSNPYFEGMVKQISQALQPQIDGQFAASGRYGSGANANAFDSALTNATSQLGYQNYSDAMNRQLTAGQALSANNANSNGQAIDALNTIQGLGGAATGGGAADIAAGQAPGSNYANILSLLGGGGGTATAAQTGKSSTTGFNLSDLFNAGAKIFG